MSTPRTTANSLLPHTRYRLRLAVAVAALGLIGTGCTEARSNDAPSDQAPAEARPDAEAAQARRTVPSGTSLSFVVDEAVSTETHAVGDRFRATLVANVSDVSGSPAMSEGTPSRWLVSESAVRDGAAVLAVQLDAIEINGEWIPVSGTVTEADIDVDNPDSDSETAAKIGVGAAAGAIIGQILGKDTRATLTGAGVGGAVGTAVALTTKSGSATLPQGSTLTVQLDAPLTIS